MLHAPLTVDNKSSKYSYKKTLIFSNFYHRNVKPSENRTIISDRAQEEREVEKKLRDFFIS